MITSSRTLAACIIALSLAVAGACAESPIEWKPLPPIPVEAGLAGTFAGYNSGKHFVAGGTNFPGAPPWENGVKKWYNDVYTLADGAQKWERAGALPRPLSGMSDSTDCPMAHGASVTTSGSILLVGGGDSKSHYPDVYRVTLTSDTPSYQRLLPLPYPLAFHSACAVGETLYVVGGISAPSDTSAHADLLCLDLKTPGVGWKQLEPMPGPGRIMPIVAAVDGKFYVAGGASLAPNSEGKAQRTYLTDAYVFSIADGWKKIASIPRPSVAAPSPAPTRGNCFYVLGGDSGENLPPVKPLAEHPGFRRDILEYDTKGNVWKTVGELPFGQVTSTCYLDRDKRITTFSGEKRPGVRTPEGWSGAFAK